ncbi:MAG: hypothetical protein SGI74_10830 [Oligoflexia bacterium]|nr:hypothetical protein [Oligoflexia bacterium]
MRFINTQLLQLLTVNLLSTALSFAATASVAVTGASTSAATVLSANAAVETSPPEQLQNVVIEWAYSDNAGNSIVSLLNFSGPESGASSKFWGGQGRFFPLTTTIDLNDKNFRSQFREMSRPEREVLVSKIKNNILHFYESNHVREVMMLLKGAGDSYVIITAAKAMFTYDQYEVYIGKPGARKKETVMHVEKNIKGMTLTLKTGASIHIPNSNATPPSIARGDAVLNLQALSLETNMQLITDMKLPLSGSQIHDSQSGSSQAHEEVFRYSKEFVSQTSNREAMVDGSTRYQKETRRLEAVRNQTQLELALLRAQSCASKLAELPWRQR